jgi:hypothetical protein
MSYTLEVDFDVYKELFAKRANESVTENDVLRELLGLPHKPPTEPLPAPTDPTSPEDWIVKNVRFPNGTDFRAKHKGQTFSGRVSGGALMVEGKAYDSPSAAAIAISGNSVNGWLFWECRFPGQASWQQIKGLRR